MVLKKRPLGKSMWDLQREEADIHRTCQAWEAHIPLSQEF